MEDSIKEVNSVFEQPWWLEAVAPGQWDCFELKKDDVLIARIPYVKSSRFGFKVLCNPQCTQTLGPWLNCNLSKTVNILSRQKELLVQLIDQIPSKCNVDFCFDSSLKYLLPFRWSGFRYEPSFSYRFEDLSDLDSIFKGMKDSRKTVIKNAQKKLIVKDDSTIDVLIEMQNKTFKRQNRSSPISTEIIQRIDDACLKHNARFLLTAEDNEGNIHASSYFVFDENRCYYLMSGANPEYRNSGAGSLLIWEGIKRAAQVSKAFDFEGSNIEDIETNFRSFGADFIVNYRVYRLNFILTMADYLKPKIKKIIGYKN